MSEAYGFDVQEWQAGELAMKATEQNIATAKTQQEKDEFALRLSKKALDSQLALEAALKKMPGLLQTIQTDPARGLAELAAAMVSSGQIEGAAELLGKSATAQKDSMAAARDSLSNRIAMGKQIGAALEGVETKTEWNAAMAGLLDLYPDYADGITDMMQSVEEAVGDGEATDQDYAQAALRVRRTVTTEVDRASNKLKEAQATYQEQLASESETRERVLIPAQAESYRSLADYRRKAGDYIAGGKQRAATQTNAKDMIAQKYTASSPEAVNVLAMDIAEQAEYILRSQPGIGRTAALRQAFNEAERAGRFAGMRVKGTTPGSSPRAPMAIPLNSDGSPDKDALISNKFYQGWGALQGTWLWDGDNFLRVRAMDEPFEDEVSEPDEEEDIDETEENY